MTTSRRLFLRGTLAGSGAIALGCGGDDGAGVSVADTLGGADPGVDAFVSADVESPDAGADAGNEPVPQPDEGPAPETCHDGFAGGTMTGKLEWMGEGDPPMNTPIGAGLDGREYFDLEQLDRGNMLTPIPAFYIRTRTPDQLDLTQPWSAEVTGRIDNPFTLTWEELEPLVEPMGTYLMECSGNGAFAHFGMLSATEWHGVPLQRIFDQSSIHAEATRVVITGFDEHSQPSANSTAGAAWVFTFDQLLSTGAFLATHMGGEPLTPDHGSPVRLFVPGWYGCTCVKWLREIRYTDDDEPATSQMVEFASRTHQTAPHLLARDYHAASQDIAAMPVRIERWEVDGQVKHRVVGIIWGGYDVLESDLEIRFGDSGFEAVDVCPAHEQNSTWTLWEHEWVPPGPGDYEIRLRVADPNVPTIRLDSGFYNRVIRVDDAG